MADPQLNAALENLSNCPDMPYRDMSPPLAYYYSSRQEKHAEKFIELAAEFVRSLEREADREELRRRAVPFAHLVGPGSRYQELRVKAYERLLLAFKQASPDGMAERLSVPQLGGDSRFPDLFVNWTDVEKYLGDAESVLRFPTETVRYCHWLNEFLSYPCQLELRQLSYGVKRIEEEVEGTHLRGNFLLVAAYDAVCSVCQDAGRYRALVTTIVMAPEIMAAAKAAAEDFFAVFSIDGGKDVLMSTPDSDIAAQAFPRAAPAQSSPLSQSDVQQMPAAAPADGKKAEKGSLSVEEAAHLACVNPGTMSRWRGKHKLAASDGTRIDEKKLVEYLKIRSLRKKPARPSGHKDSGKKGLHPWEVVCVFLTWKKEANRKKIIDYVHEEAPWISEEEIDNVLKDPKCVRSRKGPSGELLYRNPKTRVAQQVAQ